MIFKKFSFLISSIFFITLISCEEKKTDKHSLEQPNIILIIADDVSWNDIGPYGNTHIRTPNLDQLAKDGMLFNEAFLTTSSCSPSRTSIISGLYPHNTDAEQLSWPLPQEKKTFVQELKNAGYWTALAGKYHLGNAVRDDFDVLLEMQWKDAPIGLDRRLVGDGSGCDDWIKLLQNRPKDKPFFAWLASFDAHRPFYKGISDNPHNPENVMIPPYMPNTAKVKEDFALYYDEIARMDDYIGKVVSEIEAQGLTENTMIVFIADNGRAFPRDKTTLYDGGIKTPWIVKWPAKVKAGIHSNSLVSAIDIAPTFMQIAGLEPIADFEGKDLTPLLNEPKLKIHDEIYAEDHFHDYEDYARAVRTKQYKYVKNYYDDLPDTPSADIVRGRSWQNMLTQKESGTLNTSQLKCFKSPRDKEELFDIVADPNELKNLALDSKYNKVLNDMRHKLAKFRRSTNDILPSERTPDDFYRETGLPTKYRIRPRPSKAEYMKARDENRVLVNPKFKE